MSKPLHTTLGLALMLALCACSQPIEPPSSDQDAGLTNCDVSGVAAQTDNYPIAAGLAEPERDPTMVRYDRACSVFSSADERLRALVRQYLDVHQRQFGGSMVRTLEFDDGIAAMREGGAHAFERDLKGGVPYRFIGACDNECGDLDILVTDASGEILAQDVLLDNFPVATFTPEQDGRYLLVLRVFSCATEPCYGGVRVLEQRASWALTPNYGAIAITSGAFDDPHFVELEAGGYIDMQQRQSACAGFITENPDFRVTFTAGEAGRPLIFSVNADVDTTLVINGADGLWYCDDDGGALGLNPMVGFQAPQSGQYDIWVGAYGAAAVHPARLLISEQVSQ